MQMVGPYCLIVSWMMFIAFQQGENDAVPLFSFRRRLTRHAILQRIRDGVVAYIDPRSRKLPRHIGADFDAQFLICGLTVGAVVWQYDHQP